MGLAAMIGSGLIGGKTVKNLFSTPDAPSPTPPPTAGLKDEAKDETDAAKAAKKRRDLYANVGRSSTILTGPGGIEAAPPDSATPKVLLGL